jgi:predicted aconitase
MRAARGPARAGDLGPSADAPKHALKAISSAAASSGGVELWHGTGVTPEAPELAAVFRGPQTHVVTADDLARAHGELSTARDGPLDAVALGTPHFALSEFAELVRLLDGRKVKAGLPFLVSTSRVVRELARAKGWMADLENVASRCRSMSAPIIRRASGACAGAS